MTIGERIKEVRKTEKLTQQEFADRLNLKRNTVGSYEVNVVDPSDRTIKDICDKFGIREEWLRTGEGEMHLGEDARSEKIEDFINSVVRDDDDTFKKRFLEMLAGLDPADWELLERMAEKLTQKKRGEPVKGSPPPLSAGRSVDQTLCTDPHKAQFAIVSPFQQFHDGVDQFLACHLLCISLTVVTFVCIIQLFGV